MEISSSFNDQDIIIKLFNLIKNHKYDEFMDLLQKHKDIDLNIRDKANNYLIQYTILYNNKNLTSLLIERNCKIDFIDSDGKSILYIPIKYNYIELLELLLYYNKNKVGINILDINDSNGYTPLYYAILYDNLQAIEIMDNYNVNYNIQDKFGYTPLHVCIRIRNAKIANKLINKSNVNKQNNIGETALHSACNNEDVDLVKLLIDNNADPNIADYEKKLTPLIYSGVLGNVEIINILLTKDINFNLQDYNGNTALHYAAIENYAEIINLLIDNTNLKLTNIKGKTVTHYILEKNNFSFDKLRRLNFDYILSKSKMNIQDNNGNTILHYLSKYNLWINYKSILEKKKNNIYIRNIKNEKPIDYIKDKDDYIDLIAKSYLYNLRKNNKVWKDEWENLCKNKLSLDELKKINKNLADKIKVTSEDVCIDIIKYYIKNKNISLPLKINYDCIYLPLEKKVEFITFTGVTLDIIFGLLFLQKKYNNISSSLTKNFIENKKLDNYYNSLGIVKSYKIEYLNFEIIWAYQSIFFPTNLENTIKNKLINSDYLIIPIGIELSNGSHGNILIYDKNINQIERFEPNGSDYPYGFNYNPSLLDDLLELKFNNLIPNVKYVRPIEYLPKIGFQLLEAQEHYKTKKIGDPGGFCAAWSLWFADMRIKFGEFDRKSIVNKLIKEIRLSNKSFKNIIRDYSKNITDLRDEYLNKINIDINDWLNDKYTYEQLEQLHQHLFNLIDSVGYQL